MEKNVQMAQWYVVNAFSGNEDQALENIKSKIIAFGVNHLVPDIKVIKREESSEKEVKKELAPKNIKDRKNVSWTVLANGNYLKTTKREVNRYPGYLFIKMVMSDDMWYIVRNTQGVTGFIGSSGKGTKPSPVTPQEIWQLLGLSDGSIVELNDGEDKGTQGILRLNELEGELYIELDNKKMRNVQFYEVNIIKEGEKKLDSDQETKHTPKPKGEYIAHFNIGSIVKIGSGPMSGAEGTVSNINTSKGLAVVMINLFGRPTEVEVEFDQVVV